MTPPARGHLLLYTQRLVIVLTRLLILWLLSEQSLHGYRIKRILDDDGLRFWFPLEYGSIYAVLRTLVKEGHVREAAVEREGQRPQRTRYAITPAGRRHLAELLERAWLELPAPGEPIALALAARSDLADERRIPELLAGRVERLRERLGDLDRLERSAPAGEMVDRQRALTTAELAWAEALLATEGGSNG
jgi:DNA-binding PadR family transcriptional regulator